MKCAVFLNVMVVGLLFAIMPRVEATTILVPEAQNSIGDGISQASAGDVVSVKPQGSGQPYYEVVRMKAGVTVESRAGYESPVINANGADTAVVFPVITAPNTTLSGFTITNFADCGVGVEEGGYYPATVTDCTINGGQWGISVSTTSVSISHCTIEGSSVSGVSVFLMADEDGYDVSVFENVLRGGPPSGTGVQASVYSNSEVTIQRNTVLDWAGVPARTDHGVLSRIVIGVPFRVPELAWV